MIKKAQLWMAYLLAIAFAAVAALDLSSGHHMRAVGSLAFGAFFIILALRGRATP